MKIALVIDRFDPSKGGAERWIARLLESFVVRGHEVHLLSMTLAGLPQGVLGRHLDAFRFPRWLRDLSFARRAAAVLDELSPDVSIGLRHVPSVDVFLALGGLYEETLRANLLAPGGGTRRLTYGLLPKYRVLLALERRLLTRSDGPLVIAPSRLVEEHIRRRYPGRDHRVVVIRHGVDLERFRPRRPGLAGRSRVSVLFVAHNFRLKGLDSLLDAWRGLDPGRFHLKVAGRGRPPRGAARFENVDFLGPRSDIVELLQSADVLVHPTFYDPFPLIVLEALACGLPVITTRRNGAAEVMTDGLEGFLLDEPDDPDILRERLRRLEDPLLVERLGQAARRLAERFPEAELLERTAEAIEEEGRMRERRAASAFAAHPSLHTPSGEP